MVDQLRLMPQNAATLQALAQEVLCWARSPEGVPDRRITTATGVSTHIVVPAEVCAEYGAPTTFTTMGLPITCPGPGDGRVTYYIMGSDVSPLNPTDCTPLEALAAPTGLNSPANTDTTIDVAWTAVPGADGYTVQYRAATATDWSEVTATESPTTIPALTASTDYVIRVKATDSSGGAQDSAYSGTINVTTDPTP